VQSCALIGRELRKPLGQPGVALAAIRTQDRNGFLGWANELLPPVGGMGTPRDEATLFEICENLRHRGRADLLVVGELARGELKVSVERAKDGELG
jgi:hypothetical protein